MSVSNSLFHCRSPSFFILLSLPVPLVSQFIPHSPLAPLHYFPFLLLVFGFPLPSLRVI
ncbi:hypothetical protein BZA77DRAFT_316541 [Pyronema omphalodes]|nr:hypothetical protein BZA77DRAFT_316541 [Pyronema omphalodes]